MRKARRVQQDGISFQGRRYFDVTLAAYVGEDVLIRYDPSDMAEIRVYYRDAFLCRAICAELAGEQVSLKEIIQARTKQRKQLRTVLRDRTKIAKEAQKLVQPQEEPKVLIPPPSLPDPPSSPSRLKRYINE
jgi:putative transposase